VLEEEIGQVKRLLRETNVAVDEPKRDSTLGETERAAWADARAHRQRRLLKNAREATRFYPFPTYRSRKRRAPHRRNGDAPLPYHVAPGARTHVCLRHVLFCPRVKSGLPRYGLAPLRVRGLERVRLQADLVMLARLQALSRARSLTLAAWQNARVPRARVAVGVFLVLVSLALAAYGLLFIGAIWTSDTATGSLLTIASYFLVPAAILMAVAVRMLLGGRRDPAGFAEPS
jgi:hypothetical protein